MVESSIILEVKRLEVNRGGTMILKVPSLQIKQGEILALIGPNGAGKTTFLQTISYLLIPFRGQIFFKGAEVGRDYSILDYRRRLAMVFQEPLLFDTTVFHNVASGLKLRGLKKSEIRNRVMEQLERLGIAHLRDRSAKGLSGGEAQRTSLARAFALQPDLLLLDEPFAALDPPSRESILGDLEEILPQSGTTVVFATHDRQEAFALSDRVAVMRGGAFLQLGTPEEVVNHPVDEFVASFVGVETLLKGEVTQKNGGTIVVSVSGKRVEAVGDVGRSESVILCIRPEEVMLSLPPYPETVSARNVFTGKIVKMVPMGPYQKVHLDCGFPLIAYVTHHSQKALSLTEGKTVRASFKATAVTVIKKG